MYSRLFSFSIRMYFLNNTAFYGTPEPEMSNKSFDERKKERKAKKKNMKWTQPTFVIYPTVFTDQVSIFYTLFLFLVLF